MLAAWWFHLTDFHWRRTALISDCIMFDYWIVCRSPSFCFAPPACIINFGFFRVLSSEKCHKYRRKSDCSYQRASNSRDRRRKEIRRKSRENAEDGEIFSSKFVFDSDINKSFSFTNVHLDRNNRACRDTQCSRVSKVCQNNEKKYENGETGHWAWHRLDGKSERLGQRSEANHHREKSSSFYWEDSTCSGANCAKRIHRSPPLHHKALLFWTVTSDHHSQNLSPSSLLGISSYGMKLNINIFHW